PHPNPLPEGEGTVRSSFPWPTYCRVAAAPDPAYNPKSPLDQGPLKLPVLAASKSLRRSRQAGAARMDAG
ncbi:hypothetical protein, partial [Klebsiella variicola]|uniref:hypothetical protein n=1 Tax=Klebsiella variicola TaxID=244366 RepID=UPI0018C8860F